MVRFLFILAVVFIASNLQAQQISYFADSSIQVAQGSGILKYPWAGGINSVFVSKMDLNNDSIQDVILFDRTNHNVLTFLAVNQQYLHAPYYQRFFPYIDLWMLLRDYNMDGKKDMFTNGPDGVNVYKNISQGATIAWELVANPLYCLIPNVGENSLINLATNPYDVVSIEDIDHDGDLDIINFQPFTGAPLEYQRNVSMEKYNTPDSLVFNRSSNCWGGIVEQFNCNSYSFGNLCLTGLRLDATNQTEHVGAGSLLTIDLTGDNLPDLLVSKVTCQNLTYMKNVGTLDTALFMSLDTIYPQGTARIDFPDFPGIYFEDLDFDGINDIIATQAQFTNALAIPNGAIDFEHSVWFYHNGGANNVVSPLDFIQNDFLQDQMIDWGENAMPAFADYDADGDLDMFIGQLTWGYNGEYSSLKLYENVGTKYVPFFELKDNDYLKLSYQEFLYIRPVFADLNGDNAIDLAMLVNIGNYEYAIEYLLNTNAADTSFKFSNTSLQTLPVEVEGSDDPVFFDADSDNDADLLIGSFYGNLSYYQNIGSPSSPSYTLVSDSLVKPDNSLIKSFLCPVVTDINRDGKADLVTADNSGELIYYLNFIPLLSNTTTLKPTYINTGAAVNDSMAFGSQLRLAAPDLNADGYPELALGSNAGGVMMLRRDSTQSFKDTSIVYTPPSDIGYTITLFPNPALNYININSSVGLNYSVVDVLGRILIYNAYLEANTISAVLVENFTDGLYIFRFNGPGINATRKFIVQH